MEWLIFVVIIFVLFRYLSRKSDDERMNALQGVWRFDHIVKTTDGGDWNDHVVIFLAQGVGHVIPSQALRQFEWSVKGDTIHLVVPGVVKGRWRYRQVGDELNTEDLDTGNKVVFKRSTDDALVASLLEDQELLDQSGDYWDRDEYRENFIVKSLGESLTDEAKEKLADTVSRGGPPPPFRESAFTNRMFGVWVGMLNDTNVMSIDYGQDGIMVASMDGKPFQTVTYRVEEEGDAQTMRLYEDGYILSYPIRFLAGGQLHLMNPAMDLILERQP